MLRIIFNYHDPRVQLRLSALLAGAILVLCLGVLELQHPLGRRLKLLLAAALTLGCLIVGYALLKLRGA